MKRFPTLEGLSLQIQGHAPGSIITLRVLRDGAEVVLAATLDSGTRIDWAPRFLKEGEGNEFGWLGLRQAITILPSVGSLRALRAAKASTALEPFIGVGNPLLTGRDGTDKRAEAVQVARAAAPKQTSVASLYTSIAALFSRGGVNVEDLRRQPPLSRDGR